MAARFIFSFVLFFIAGNIYSQTLADTLLEIDDIFSDRYKSGIPGCQLAISKNGKLIYSKAWGMADLEHDVSLTTSSIIEAGSVSKQFVAASMLLLEQQGKISMSDDIRKYFPEIPDYGKVITLDHMMRHTSGIKDWGAIAQLAGWPRTTKTYRNEDALKIITQQKSLNHDPGAEYMYSNSNYNLFALLIEKVSGLTLAEYSEKYIFEPAGMDNTQWRDDYKRIVPNRAMAYGKNDSGEYFTEMPNEYVYGNGGLLTTAEDLLKWNEYYLNDKFGNPSLLPKMTEVKKLNSGAKNNYAAGLFMDDFNGVPFIQHSGATAGYRCYLSYFPSEKLSIACMSNTSEFDGNSILTYEVESLFFEPDLNEYFPEGLDLDKNILEKYVGVYKNTRSNYPFVVSIAEGYLKISGASMLAALDDSTFQATNKNKFVFGKDKISIITPKGDRISGLRMEESKVSVKSYSEYIGEFYSEETQSKYYVNMGSENLMISDEKGNFMRAYGCYKDGFSVDDFNGVVLFERDKNKKVTKMIVSTPRARKVIFEKIGED